nr:hypothetical protein [Tanacetum cinerariifolium]
MADKVACIDRPPLLHPQIVAIYIPPTMLDCERSSALSAHQHHNPEGCATAFLALLRSARVSLLLPKSVRQNKAWRWPECLP